MTLVPNKNLNAVPEVTSGPGSGPSPKLEQHSFPTATSSAAEPSLTYPSYNYRHSLDTQGACSATSWISPTRAAGRLPPRVLARAEPESALPTLLLHAVVFSQ